MKHINFDLQQLQAFVAVAERGSFREGAEHIHLSPSALSRRIDKLESILGARLFNRTTREVELTSLGRIFLERASTALDDLELAMLGISDIAATRSGHVTVACVPSAALYFLPEVVRTFSETYPLVRIRLIDEAASQVLASVVSGESDFGISFMGNLVPQVDFEPIHTDPFVLAVPRSHQWASSTSISWSDLVHERMISVARSSGNRQILDDVLAKAGINPSYRFEVSHIATLLGMVEAGLGLAVVPKMALPPVHPSLQAVRLDGPAVSRELGVAKRRGVMLRAPAQIFHDHLKMALKARR